ncbi:MAG: hypothetical protein ACRDND_32305, partial [Streptosporangiaceae bacterium]
MIAAIDRSGASIVGFQEFEPPQAAEFTRQARRWGLVRGRTRGHPDSRDAIAYLRSRWTPVLRRYVRIRYAGGHVGVPLVQLASTSGPGSVWVLNTHNPANAVGGSGRIRDAAVAAEAAALNQVVAANPGARAFLTGDMNDHARFRREFTAHAAGWTPANRNAGQIDWIVGSPGVGFTRVVVDTATNDHAHHYTDHPFVYATVAGDATGPGSRNPGSPISGVGRAGLAADHPAPAASTTTSTRSSPAGPPRGGGVNQAGGGYRIGRWTLNAEQFHDAQQLVSSADARGGTDAAVVITTA